MRSSSEPTRNATIHPRPTLNTPNRAQSFSTAHQFHRRNAVTTPIVKPSHKPPSTFHSFRGDIKSQDIFVEQLRSRNSGVRILFPGADKFEMIRMDVWNHDAICTPCLIMQPVSKKEVSDCLKGYVSGVHKCLTANRKYGTNLAVPRLSVAGGRNSYNCMKDGSIVLDLSRMKRVTVDPNARTCQVSGGAKIIDVDTALAEHGLMAVLGTHQFLGVVGCILSGGLGYASRKYGLASDNVIEAEIILADGRLKRCCRNQHADMFYATLAGGGGFGVVVSLTLRCYPLRHAALLTFEIPSTDIRDKRSFIRNWANWIMGDIDNDGLIGEDVLHPRLGCPDDVFSQLIIPSDTSPVLFLATSVDTDAIQQHDGYLEDYRVSQKKSAKRSIFKSFKTSSSDSAAPGWADVPGLSDLIIEKLGATRQRLHFELVRYSDQLQSHSNNYFSPGNIFCSFKYIKSFSNRILEILVQASSSEISPKNESKIVIYSMGGEISNINSETSAFCARDMNYMIYVEGKWEAGTSSRVEKEKNKVLSWVRWIVIQLHLCEGVMSTTHPESNRDQVSKSGKSSPLLGWYNCSPFTGKHLINVKNKRDPRNVFSLASRISFPQSFGDLQDVDDVTIASDIKKADGKIKEGEIDPTECLSPQKSYGRSSSPIGDSFDGEEGDNEDDENAIKTKLTDDSIQDEDISSDVRNLLSLTDVDDDLKDWSLAPAILTRDSFDSAITTKVNNLKKIA